MPTPDPEPQPEPEPKPQPSPAPVHGAPIRGTLRDDLLVGTASGEVIEGYSGDDLFWPGGGEDTLLGGGGADTALLGADRASVVLSRDAAGRAVLEWPAGSTTLDGVERAALADGSYLFGPDGPGAEHVYLLYRASLGRTPDADGFLFWAERHAEGLSRAEIAAAFHESGEISDRLGGDGSDAALLELLYGEQLDRTPDAAGRDFWLAALAEGRIDRPGLMSAFAEAAETRALAGPDMAAGFWVSDGWPEGAAEALDAAGPGWQTALLAG